MDIKFLKNFFYEVCEEFVYIENNGNYITLIKKMEQALLHDDWEKQKESFQMNIEVLLMILPDEQMVISYDFPKYEVYQHCILYNSGKTMNYKSSHISGLVAGQG